MRIALVHEMLVKMGGAERVLSALTELFPDAPIYTLLYDEKKCGDAFPKNRVRPSRLQTALEWGIPRQFLVTKMPRAIEDFDFSEFDIVISSSSAFAHGIIVPTGVLHICYCHSPMRYAWDYTHEYIREKTSGKFSFLKKWLLQRILSKLRLWDAVAAGRPDILLANSETTKSRIEKYWRRDDAKVLYPPVDGDRFSLSHSKRKYFLIVSALEKFKRIDIAVEAFSKMPNLPLVIIGEGSERKNLEKMAGSNIEFLGRKTDGETNDFFEHCRGFVFPGLEDFGIAPVEAMLCGKPILAYGKGGVTESVAHEQTGLFFPEQKADSLKTVIEKFLSLEEKFVKNAKQIRTHAEKFGKEYFQKTFLEILEQKRS